MICITLVAIRRYAQMFLLNCFHASRSLRRGRCMHVSRYIPGTELHWTLALRHPYIQYLESVNSLRLTLDVAITSGVWNIAEASNVTVHDSLCSCYLGVGSADAILYCNFEATYDAVVWTPCFEVCGSEYPYLSASRGPHCVLSLSAIQ